MIARRSNEYSWVLGTKYQRILLRESDGMFFCLDVDAASDGDDDACISLPFESGRRGERVSRDAMPAALPAGHDIEIIDRPVNESAVDL